MNNIKMQPAAHTPWHTQRSQAAQQATTFTHPVVTLIPTDKTLRLDDSAFSAYCIALLDAWPTANIKCEAHEDIIIIPNTKEGSLQLQRHFLACTSCCGGLKTLRHDLVNQGIATVCRRHGAIYTVEPKNWPLRDKTKFSGREGPDGLLHIGESIRWTDVCVTAQDPRKGKSMFASSYTSKIRTYAEAASLGIEVIPIVVSHLGALAPQSKVFEKIIRETGPRAWREVNNMIGVRLARTLGLFVKYCAIKSSKIQSIEK